MKKLFIWLTVLAVLFTLCACGNQAASETTAPAGHCTVSIDCTTVLQHSDELAESKREIVPEDGYMLKETDVTIGQGETVYDVFTRVCMDNGIQFDTPYTPMYSGYYVNAVGNLYPGDCGDLSGWMVCIDGQFPSEGIGLIEAKDGMTIQVRFTCDMGSDIGAEY